MLNPDGASMIDVKTSADRLGHFGPEDRVRIFGGDVRGRISGAGFEVDEFTVNPADCLAIGAAAEKEIMWPWNVKTNLTSRVRDWGGVYWFSVK